MTPRHTSTSKTRSVHLFGTLLLVLVLLSGCTASESDSTGQPESAESAQPVTITQVRTETLQETIQAIGSLRADQTTRISPEIAGTIEEVAFTEGNIVEKGEILVRLDDDTLREQYQSRKYALEEAEANLQNTKRTFERNQRLHERDMISGQELDNAQTAFESARARVNQLKSQVQEARERLEDATIRAPFTGYVGSREIDSGNYVQPGTTLTVLYRLDPLEVRFTIPERFVGRARNGQTINLHVSSSPDTVFQGEVYFVSPSVREQTRDLLVKASVDNPTNLLKPGAFARVELVVDTLKDRPVVPAESLIVTRDGYIVFTVIDGKATRQPVEIGLRQPGLVEIRKGLETGDRIIAAGHLGVSDGTPVSPGDGNE